MTRINCHKLLHIIDTDPLNEKSWFFKCLLPEWFSHFTRRERNGTILFIDMSGSVWNKFADEPGVWRINICTLHSRAKKIISICKGVISKTIGDCVMAYFLGNNHKENAYLCAISLLDTFYLLKSSYDPDGDSTMFKFPITIGVASGPIVFLGRKDPYGLPVDLAARLQNLASPGEIVMFYDSYKVEDETIAKLTKAVKKKQETLEVKGFGEVVIFRITTPNNATQPTQ